MQKWRDAHELFEESITQENDCGEFRTGAAYCLWRLGEREAALAQARLALNCTYGKDEAWCLIQLAHIFTECKDREEEKIAFERYVKADPYQEWGWLQLGIVNARLGLQDTALEYYNKALALNPSYGIAYTWRGKLFLEREEFVSALNDFEQAVLFRPKECYAWAKLLWTYSHFDKYDNAKNALSRVPTGCWNDVGVAREASHIYSHFQDWWQVVNELERVLKQRPNDWRTRLSLAETYGYLFWNRKVFKALQPAITNYNEVINHQPDNLAALHALSKFMVAAQDSKAAKQVSSQILKLDPGDKSARCIQDAKPGLLFSRRVHNCWKELRKAEKK